MKMSLKLMIAALIMALMGGSSPGYSEDILPWPVGSECPFPWSSIEGDWFPLEAIEQQKLHFEVSQKLKDGTKVLDVLHYNSTGNLIGWGRGISPKGEKIVRLRMEYVSADRTGEYWGIVRAYVPQGEPTPASCARSRRVTVFTLRPIDKRSKENEIHLFIEKASSRPNQHQED